MKIFPYFEVVDFIFIIPNIIIAILYNLHLLLVNFQMINFFLISFVKNYLILIIKNNLSF